MRRRRSLRIAELPAPRGARRQRDPGSHRVRGVTGPTATLGRAQAAAGPASGARALRAPERRWLHATVPRARSSTRAWGTSESRPMSRSTGGSEGPIAARAGRTARQMMRRDRKPGEQRQPGLSAFNRSDGFQLGLDFLRLVGLGLRAIGWRARPQTVDHRLGLFALLGLGPCPLQEESFLVAHGRPPAMILWWAPWAKDSTVAATPTTRPGH